MSIAQQKSDLREIIHRKVKRHIEEKPEAAPAIALEAVTRLSERMTLKELQDWNFSLHAPEWFALLPETEL